MDGGVGNGLANSGAVIHFYPSLSDFLIYFDYDSEQISSKCVDLKIGIAGTEFTGYIDYQRCWDTAQTWATAMVHKLSD